jgi:hypothetical protein
MKQEETYTRHKRSLVTIQLCKDKKYLSVDLDTWRDGYFDLPQEATDRIKSIIRSYGLIESSSNHKGFYIPKVPVDLAEELAQRIAQVAVLYRNCCEYSEWLSLTGRRAPLFGWIDRKGRRLKN